MFLAANQSDRCIGVEWSAESSQKFMATIEVRAFDRQNLLADVTKVFSDHGMNIMAADTSTSKDSTSTMRFEVELADNAQIQSLIQRLRRINYVYTAKRVTTGGK